jgi:hypothetical protein
MNPNEVSWVLDGIRQRILENGTLAFNAETDALADELYKEVAFLAATQNVVKVLWKEVIELRGNKL